MCDSRYWQLPIGGGPTFRRTAGASIRCPGVPRSRHLRSFDAEKLPQHERRYHHTHDPILRILAERCEQAVNIHDTPSDTIPLTPGRSRLPVLKRILAEPRYNRFRVLAADSPQTMPDRCCEKSGNPRRQYQPSRPWLAAWANMLLALPRSRPTSVLWAASPPGDANRSQQCERDGIQ